MALGSAQMTTTTQANFIPEFWGPFTIVATEAKLVFEPLTWDWTPGLDMKKGDIIHIPGVSNLTSNAKAANTQVVLNAPTEDVTNLTVNRHDECSFLLEDITKVQASFNLQQLYTQKAGFAIAQQRDTRIVNLIPSLTQIVGTAGVDIGDQQIRDAIELLDLAIAPDEDRHLVLYPTQKNALWGIEKYFRADIRGNGVSPVVNGKFGEIYGINTYVTTNITTSGAPAARLNVLFQRQWAATANQLGVRTQADYILEYLGTLVVNDRIYGETTARSTFGVWIRS